METKVDYDQKALIYAEKYGVISYSVEGNSMTYYEEALESFEQLAAYKATVNLDTMKESRELVQ